jgi:BRCA1-associated protein
VLTCRGSFYEEQVRGAQSKLSDALAALDAAHSATSSSSTREAALEARVAALEEEASLARAAAARSEARAQKALEVARRVQSELSSERSVSEGLMRRLEAGKAGETKLAADVAELKVQNADLQEQMRDL